MIVKMTMGRQKVSILFNHMLNILIWFQYNIFTLNNNCYCDAEKRDRRDRHRDEKSDKEKTDEERARDMIKKAKVEDDEYKTEEQTYYR